MSSMEEEKKKKPKIDYNISQNGNWIDASIDEKTHFISFRRTAESKTRGGVGIGLTGGKGEAEKERKDEWTAIVWEDGQVMPPSVWSEKRRKELLDNISGTISLATGSAIDKFKLSAASGTVIPWNIWSGKTCKHCGSEIHVSSKFCPACGKPQ